MTIESIAVLVRWTVIATLSLQLSVLLPALAAEAPQCLGSSLRTCAKAVEGEFQIDSFNARPGQSASPTTVKSQSSRPGEGALVFRSNYVETFVTVGCGGNTPANNDAVCGAALDGCPDPAAVQFWEWTRTIDGATGQPLTPYQRTFDPPYVCLAPAETQAAGAVVDPIAAIAAIVQRDFRSLVVLKGATKVTPSPETLVNLPTRFTTDAPETYEIPVTVLGRGVRITASAQQYQWFLGEGILATDKPEVLHTYRAPGEPTPYVTITWSGTFTIAGNPVVRQVQGTASTTGPATPLGVREVRSQYEAD